MSVINNIPPRALKTVNILLLIALLPSASLFFRDYLLYRSSMEKVEPIKVRGGGALRGADIGKYAPIVETGVFPSHTRKFIPLAAPDGGRIAPGNASKVLKGLRLIGTYVGPQSFAVISKAGRGIEKIFKNGDKVFDAGILVGIHEKGVDILVAGRTGRLMIPEVKIPRSPPIRLNGEGLTGKKAVVARSATSPANTGLRYSRKAGANKWIIDRKAVTASLNNISSMLTDARLTPVTGNGAVGGFILTEIKPRGVFDALGLKNGDILKSVNGYPIDSPEKAVRVLSALKGERSINLDVVRNKVKMSFHYDIR